MFYISIECTIYLGFEIMYINALIKNQSVDNFFFIFNKLDAMSLVHFQICKDDSLDKEENIVLMLHKVNVDVVTFKETETTAL